jgi:micrococcal nuclease
MKKIMIFLGGILISGMALAGEVVLGTVVTVIDGNTVEVLGDDQETYKVMLQGIDCPEIGQEFGDKAKEYLQQLLLDKPVTVEMKGKDRWGNRLGVVLINGDDPRSELLKAGLAWTSEVNPDPQFEGLKDQAREKGMGLWKETNPTPPWVYRRLQTRTQFKSS